MVLTRYNCKYTIINKKDRSYVIAVDNAVLLEAWEKGKCVYWINDNHDRPRIRMTEMLDEERMITKMYDWKVVIKERC
jgi:hypothetical protein